MSSGSVVCSSTRDCNDACRQWYDLMGMPLKYTGVGASSTRAFFVSRTLILCQGGFNISSCSQCNYITGDTPPFTTTPPFRSTQDPRPERTNPLEAVSVVEENSRASLREGAIHVSEKQDTKGITYKSITGGTIAPPTHYKLTNGRNTTLTTRTRIGRLFEEAM